MPGTVESPSMSNQAVRSDVKQISATTGVLSSRRLWLFRLTVATAIALGQEAVFRWMFPIPEVTSFNRINYTPLDKFSLDFTRIKERGLSNVKIRWESEPDGFTFDHTLNLYGFRGPNFSIDPPKDRPRILFVGDSFAEGCGASDSDTIAEQFARILEPRQPIEAISLGVAGTGFPEYVQIVRDGLSLLKPAAVFLVVFANDLPAPALSQDAQCPPATLERPKHLVPRALEVIYRLASGRAAPRRFADGPYPFFEEEPASSNRLTREEPPPNIDPKIESAMRRGKANSWNAGALPLYEKMLRHDLAQSGGAQEYLRFLATVCRNHEARLTIAYVPYCAVTNPYYIATQKKLGAVVDAALKRMDVPPYRKQQDHLRDSCRAINISFVDTTDSLIHAEQTVGHMFWPIDGHCNASGYRLIAEALARSWNETGPSAALSTPALHDGDRSAGPLSTKVRTRPMLRSFDR
jgi:lysophospholipase L1-like esterase